MVFVPALTTFVISDLLGGGKLLLIGNVIEQSFKQNSNWHVGSGLSLVLMVFIIASMALVAKYDKGEGRYGILIKKLIAEAVSGSDFYNTLRSYCHLDSPVL